MDFLHPREKHLKKNPISNHNFQLKMVPLDAKHFKLSMDMCFCPKRSFAACPYRGKVKSRAENWRENQKPL